MSDDGPPSPTGVVDFSYEMLRDACLIELTGIDHKIIGLLTNWYNDIDKLLDVWDPKIPYQPIPEWYNTRVRPYKFQVQKEIEVLRTKIQAYVDGEVTKNDPKLKDHITSWTARFVNENNRKRNDHKASEYWIINHFEKPPLPELKRSPGATGLGAPQSTINPYLVARA